MKSRKSGDVSRRQVLQVSAGLVAAANGIGAATLAATPAQAQPGPRAAMQLTDYFLRRVKALGADTLFGVPGRTCDPVFEGAVHHKMNVVLTATDLEAGYAADAYARVRENGLGVVAVTYGVGTLSLVNAIAGANVERSPVVIVNGGPSDYDLGIFKQGFMFSHCGGKVDTDLKIFSEVTAFAGRANNTAEAADIIDRALTTAVRKKRPVYIEIPRNLWRANIMAPVTPAETAISPSGAEGDAAQKILAFLRGAERPAVLLGVEVQRYGAIEQTAALMKKLGIPYSTTMLAKSVIAENTPNFVGVYDSRYAPPNVMNVVEKSDRLLALGCVFGVQHLALLSSLRTKVARVFDGEVNVRNDNFKGVSFKALVEELNRANWAPNPVWSSWISQNRLSGLSFDQRRAGMKSPPSPPSNETAMTYEEVMRSVSDFLDESFVTITDTSLSMYPAADMDIKGAGGMFCNAVWQSIGYSVAAAVGAGVAQEKRRPLVICGDGGFQMTAQSLSTMALRNIRSVVIVLDNGFYGIEQFLIDRSYFNNPASRPPSYLSLQPWKYADLARSFGINAVWEANSVDSFKEALRGAKAAQGPAFIAVKLKRKDLPPELRA